MTARIKKQYHWLKSVFTTFSCGVVSTLASSLPALSADRIAFYYPPFGEFSISTNDLEIFAREGRITDDFSFYASRIPKTQQAQFRQILDSWFQLNPTLVSQFTYSPLGEQVVERLGELLLTENRLNGSRALRSALILAATHPKGLNIVNVIRRYPSNTIQLNLSAGQQIIANLGDSFRKRDAIVGGLKQLAEAEIANQPQIDFTKLPDLRRPGNFGFQKKTLPMNDLFRQRAFFVDLYLPQKKSSTPPKAPFPLIVISHGVAEDRETFAYAAQHLASYGFAIAVLEHPGSDAKKIQLYFSGLAGSPKAEELIDRPLDVKFVLDQLQRDNESGELPGKLNLKEVGAIGHSYGGYTILALAGAPIDTKLVPKRCDVNNDESKKSFVNLSIFLQCRANELIQKKYPIPSLQDPRIKAVMAINPLNSVILGENGLRQIQVPVMLMGGSQDIITPAVPEQVTPFTWLQTQSRYLAIIDNATHFSTSEKLNTNKQVVPVPKELIGPNPAIAQTYVKALSVAFFQTHLLNQQQYRPYLTSGYSQYISQSPLNISLVQSLSTEQLDKIFEQ